MKGEQRREERRGEGREGKERGGEGRGGEGRRGERRGAWCRMAIFVWVYSQITLFLPPYPLSLQKDVNF